MYNALNHDGGVSVRHGFKELFLGRRDELGAVVRCLAAAQDNVGVRIAFGLDNARQAVFGHAHESMRRGTGPHGINSNTDGAVSAYTNTSDGMVTVRELGLDAPFLKPTGLDVPETSSRWI